MKMPGRSASRKDNKQTPARGEFLNCGVNGTRGLARSGADTSRPAQEASLDNAGNHAARSTAQADPDREMADAQKPLVVPVSLRAKNDCVPNRRGARVIIDGGENKVVADLQKRDAERPS